KAVSRVRIPPSPPIKGVEVTVEKKLGTAARWAGGITAVLSLAVALYQFTLYVNASWKSTQKAAELLEIAANQQGRSLYAEAWATLEEAKRLGKRSDEVDLAQENLAMAWLQNSRLVGGQTFSQLAGAVEPVLDRGMLKASRERKADLQAHLGWATFLRSREVGGLNPEAAYRGALELDPANPYAHAMLGHWLLWNGADFDGAAQHFESAVASGRARDFVRHWQFSALKNKRASAESGPALIRAANDMRKSDDSKIAGYEREIAIVYDEFMGRDEIGTLLSVVPPDEHLATIHWLFDGTALDDSRGVVLLCYEGRLQEAAGQAAEAQQTFAELRSKLESRPQLFSDRIRNCRELR
ncbi:MAG: hypothetical protein ACREU7_02310, partial [Burkholderiales bacterium]